MFQHGRDESIGKIRAGLDVLIVGGGINGAGILRDLAMRDPSLRIGLAEARHFSSGTSGKNSQLIHGGLRYLENLEFDLVREALLERETLIRIAPHLVEPLPLIIPYYGLGKRLYYGAGLVLYDFLAGKRNIGRRRQLSVAETAVLEPGLSRDGLTSAAVYYDCQVHSARLVLENLFDASRRGAAIANYLRVLSWAKNPDGGFSVQFEDSLSGARFESAAGKIVDARGPWEGGPNLRLVRGSHIVVPRITHSDHAIAHFNPDGRILFIIPWGTNNALSLIGTTDIDHDGTPDEVRISSAEVDYLRRATRALFPGSAVEPVAAYASLRPLVAASGQSASKTSRSHKIGFGADGVLKISGGKYTTYRVMSLEAVDLLCPELAGRSGTAAEPLGRKTAEAVGLLRFHGQHAAAVLAIEAPSLEDRMIAHAVRHEMAMRLADVMFVSTYWGHERTWTAETLRPLAWFMGSLTGWDEARVESEIELVLTIARMPEVTQPPRRR